MEKVSVECFGRLLNITHCSELSHLCLLKMVIRLKFGMNFQTMYAVHHLLRPPGKSLKLARCKSHSGIAFPLSLRLYWYDLDMKFELLMIHLMFSSALESVN